MRTTVNIDDDVLEIARRRAVEESRSLGALITEALRARLARRAPEPPDRYVAVSYGEGGTLPGIDLTDNAAVREAMERG